MSVSRILIGDDGSPAAEVARSWARQLSGASGAELHVRRVEIVDALGSGAAGLLEQAADLEVDLIVVGRRGGGGFPALRLGSTAHQVAEHATVPVAVVPLSGTPGESEWPFSRVAVGVDGSRAAGAASTWAASLVSAASARLWAVHALDLGPAFAAAGLGDDAYALALRNVSETLEREWGTPFRDAAIGYTSVVNEGGAAEVLLDAVRANDADLLVVGRREAGGARAMAMGSVAHRAIGFAPCATVVVASPG
jgi:nucleotide-binding universal stress UspA family protein